MGAMECAEGNAMRKYFLTGLLALSLSCWCACGGSGSGTSGGGGAATHFSVTGPAGIPSGTPFNVTVIALDASNNRVPRYSGTVHFTSSDAKAQLAPDVAVMSGSGTFPASLTTAGSQSITVTDTASTSITGNSGSINVGAVPGAFLVEMFGAKGDGHSDDTAAIQSAISAAAAGGGGSVVFGVRRYFTTGAFVVPQGVVLCGSIEGPFDVSGVDPAVTAIAPTLLVTNSSAPFITLSGVGAGVADLLFHYPNQVPASASTPTVYPYTITMQGAPGAKVVRSTVTNAYNFLDIEVGRVMAQDLFIGAFNIGVFIDHTYDFVTLHNLHHGVFWDEVANASYPQPIDNWVLSHGTALIVNQMDALEVHDFYVFSRFTGIFLTNSSDLTEPGIRCAWGTGSDIDLERVQYGIVADSTNSPGFEFTNVQMAAAPGLGQAAVQLRAGGTSPPDLIVSGGAVRGTWGLGAFPTPGAGTLTLLNLI